MPSGMAWVLLYIELRNNYIDGDVFIMVADISIIEPAESVVSGSGKTVLFKREG
jgi:hypothetical protein